ncbi:Tetratricopeptide repeat/TPR repeat [Leishmania donovani]|uniref:Tetratricopeptide_repeat/TPR_repeat_-_putative n=3 Tax=Leishmania donovani species complex TaxID=38574 RepID=A0A6L0WPT5_LEIIN|nr:conserved hypothetical protein [Leishmania infantum JPCM5]AYU75946.1 Tetratricopeptide repeat/TPR repeat, putative [Leishmania donovani]CAC9443221.1 Tetratricopeptide_repeat/TPR_repeat_-_putative [Leishmania infantum]CAJ1986012.1 Tetratricopeptide repeat/TPR repeat [Leishmania donovani]CAM65350.1 conserved hypothetical protein [Leishmania infantum JPCM5]SUZ38961.1 Tetratricopeptide_repeat/TPR_repeat_-_putative [Leishmania infantum]|eukprot:XP_001463004.1 conserved hypothetical protein [Leishmania infantum JPCM5]
MSATPPPPSSNASTAYPHARASPGTYRGTGSGAYSRGSSYQPSESSPSSSPIYTSSHSRRGGGSTRVRAHTYGSVHADPAASRAAAPPASRTSAPRATPDVATPPLPSASSAASPPLSFISSDVLSSLNASVQESLSGYLYTDAIELAQRLFDLEASYAHLHLLAHCYTVSGAAGTAYRLLQHYYPFLELHVTRPWTAGASTSAAGGAAGGVGSGFLPFDARRTWTASYGVHPPQHPFSSGMSSTAAAATFSASSNENNVTSDEFELGYETVDLQSQWDCQYLLGVCCYRTQHYEDGAKVLSQLLYVCHQVTTISSVLRRRLQQLRQQQQQQVAGRSDTSEEDDAGVAAAVRTTERQLRTCAFVTEARTSQVLYWLGLCEKHRQRHPIAAEHLRRAYVAHPLRLDAFHEYVHLAWPSEQVVQSLLAVKESLIEEEDRAEVDVTEPPQQRQRPPQRRGRDATDIAVDVDADADDEEQRAPRSAAAVAALASGGGGNHSAASVSPHATQLVRAGPSAVTLPAPCLTAQQRRCAQQHLRPFLHAAFLGITYRCPEAVETLHALLAQEQQQQRAAAAAAALGSASSSTVASLHGSARAGMMRSSSSSSAPLWKNQGGGSAATGAVASTASPWLLRQLALAHFHNGDIQESADAFEQLLRTAPWELMSPALIFYSTALWHLKSESALGSLAQRLTDAEPLSATTLCVVANAYSLIKDPRDALVMLKRAVQVAPTLAYAHALHGYELLGQDSKAEAEAAFKAALAVDASLYIAYAGLGERFMREEQIDKARGYYKEAVKLNPTPAIINRFALTYHRQGKSLADLKTALRLYTESLERHPNNVTARRQRADVLLRLDQPLQALEELKALLVECPGEAVVYVTLAECMVCLRRPHEALQHYQTAMHLDPRRESYVQGCIDQLVAANML